MALSRLDKLNAETWGLIPSGLFFQNHVKRVSRKIIPQKFVSHYHRTIINYF